MPAARAPRLAASPTAPMSVAFVMQTLARMGGEDTIVVEEAPSSRAMVQAHLPFTHSATFFTMDSGGLGYACRQLSELALPNRAHGSLP